MITIPPPGHYEVEPAELTTNSKAARIAWPRTMLGYLRVREFGDYRAELAGWFRIRLWAVSKTVGRPSVVEGKFF